MSMNITFNPGTQGTQNTGGPQGGGNKTEELQNKFDQIKDKPEGAEKTQALKDLKKDVDKELKNEEKKDGGGNEDMMKMLLQLLQMIMQMMQQSQGGDEGGNEKNKSKEGPK